MRGYLNLPHAKPFCATFETSTKGMTRLDGGEGGLVGNAGVALTGSDEYLG